MPQINLVACESCKMNREILCPPHRPIVKLHLAAYFDVHEAQYFYTTLIRQLFQVVRCARLSLFELDQTRIAELNFLARR